MEKQPQERNKERSKQVILDTAIKLLKEKGIKNFTVENLAKRSGKSRRLIYNYYGNVDEILKAVLNKSDFWLTLEERIEEVILKQKSENTKNLASLVFSNHCDTFYKDSLIQEISALELTNKSGLLYNISNSRERIGEKLFEVAEPDFENTNVSIRMLSAILIGGINYVLLHSKTNASTFCGLNLNNEQDFNLLKKTIDQIIGWAYEAERQ